MDKSIDALLDGFQRFRQRYFVDDRGLFEVLSRQGQSPRVAVVACCDSRVDPALVLDTAPGDLFTVRNVANLVPPYEPEGTYHGTSAALEFAVRVLNVEHVLVLGHAQCGGIRALMEGAPALESGAGDDFISAWMGIAADVTAHLKSAPPGAERAQRLRAAERAAIHVSLDNLLTFPWIRSRVEAGRLRLHGWYFDLGCGELAQLVTVPATVSSDVEEIAAGPAEGC